MQTIENNKISIFEFGDYKGYLARKIREMPKNGRGFRAYLAEQIGCQKTFISQVLQGDAHFNLEHAEKINQVLKHSSEEAFFFLLLIQYARAGTEALRARFSEQMEQLLAKRLQLKNRLQNDKDLSIEVKSKYYSSWIFGAIRVACTIPKLRSRAALLDRLGIPENQLDDALLFLEEKGLIERKGSSFFPTTAHLHLAEDSDFLVRHHTNWRLRGLDAIAIPRREDLHYSSVISISAADAKRLKAMTVKFLEEAQTVIKASPEENLYSFCADLFEL